MCVGKYHRMHVKILQKETTLLKTCGPQICACLRCDA